MYYKEPLLTLIYFFFLILYLNASSSSPSAGTCPASGCWPRTTGPVRWREISLQLSENGIEKVVEIGPGNVLTGLIKRTATGLILENIRNAEELPE